MYIEAVKRGFEEQVLKKHLFHNKSSRGTKTILGIREQDNFFFYFGEDWDRSIHGTKVTGSSTPLEGLYVVSLISSLL